MSKTFKSALDSPVTLEVEDTFGLPGVYLTIGQSVILLGLSDIPSLMLALGECLPPLPDFVRDGSYEAYMAVVVTYLDKAVRALESETAKAKAKAKEQAELETCALEMLNALRKHHGKPERSWEDTHVEVREEFLVLARRARELGGRVGE